MGTGEFFFCAFLVFEYEMEEEEGDARLFFLRRSEEGNATRILPSPARPRLGFFGEYEPRVCPPSFPSLLASYSDLHLTN